MSFRLEGSTDILRGGGNLDKKVHQVNWKVVCSSKENGDLGLRCLSNFDRALLGK